MVFRQQVESQSKGQIKLVVFKKTDGQQFITNDVKGYKLDFEAEITFEKDGSWLAWNKEPGFLGFEFSPPEILKMPNGGSVKVTPENCIEVGHGDRKKVIGLFIATKKESGWKFEVNGICLVSKTSTNREVAVEIASQRKACISNLLQINSAIDQWAVEENKRYGVKPSWPEIDSYFKEKTPPHCPSGGRYTLYQLGIIENPRCNVPGHVPTTR